MPGHSLRSALGESRVVFCALRTRSLFFQRWLVHGREGAITAWHAADIRSLWDTRH
jgi:hypothetical protein